MGVEVPEKINDGSVEVCSVCEAVTVAGIYDILPINHRLNQQN
jgi:hypothetical protein